MGGGLDKVRERMAEHLNANGIEAITAWESASRIKRDDPVVVVSLRGCTVESGGFQDYLGERQNSETGKWEELYGRKAKVVLGFDVYAPASVGDSGIQSVFDRLTQCLSVNPPSGVVFESISCGETEYEQDGRVLKRKIEASCRVYLYAVTEVGGTFLNFEMKGEVKY